MPTRPLITAVVASWLALVSVGMWLVADHATTGGSVGTIAPNLAMAAAKQLGWNGECNLLILAAHPQCPCLPATLDELGAVFEKAENTTLRVLVFEPTKASQDWDPEARDTLFGGLPKETVIADRDGDLARRLGAKTSGHLSLYSTDGRLLFTGGITGSRGHRGDNQNRRALTAALQQARAHPGSRAGNASGAGTNFTRTVVYGCPLDTPCDCKQ